MDSVDCGRKRPLLAFKFTSSFSSVLFSDSAILHCRFLLRVLFLKYLSICDFMQFWRASRENSVDIINMQCFAFQKPWIPILHLSTRICNNKDSRWFCDGYSAFWRQLPSTWMKHNILFSIASSPFGEGTHTDSRPSSSTHPDLDCLCQRPYALSYNACSYGIATSQHTFVLFQKSHRFFVIPENSIFAGTLFSFESSVSGIV